MQEGTDGPLRKLWSPPRRGPIRPFLCGFTRGDIRAFPVSPATAIARNSQIGVDRTLRGGKTTPPIRVNLSLSLRFILSITAPPGEVRAPRPFVSKRRRICGSIVAHPGITAPQRPFQRLHQAKY